MTDIPEALFDVFVRRAISYDPNTGVLLWKERYAGIFDGLFSADEGTISEFNNRFAGTEALGCVDSRYKTGMFLYRRMKAHRVAWLLQTGSWPKMIDHRNRVGTDNRFSNLRETTHSGNMKNLSLRKDSSSGHAGVSRTRGGKWLSYIYVEGVRRNLGTHPEIGDAVAARKAAEAIHGFGS